VLARHPDPPAAVQRLAEQGVIVDSRGDYVRFSPHFYNTLEDNARAVEALSR
jgi:kynureninase